MKFPDVMSCLRGGDSADISEQDSSYTADKRGQGTCQEVINSRSNNASASRCFFLNLSHINDEASPPPGLAKSRTTFQCLPNSHHSPFYIHI